MKIPYKAIQAIAKFTAQDDPRWYLNGVLVESNGRDVRAVATNGHILGMWKRDSSEDAGKAILSNATVKDMLKMAHTKKEKEASFDITVNDIEVLVSFLGVTAEQQAVDGTFPDYERVIPEETSGKTAQFNPEYLVLFAQVDRIFGDLKRDDVPQVHVAYNGTDAAKVTCGHVDEFVGVIMPKR